MDKQTPDSKARRLEIGIRERRPEDRSNNFCVESLIDALVVLYDECCSSNQKRERTVVEFVERVKPVIDRVKECRLTADDFEVLEVIGRGAFGEVKVVRLKSTNKVYALKVLNKAEMLQRQTTACFKEERDVLVFGNRDWITKLHYAFQDKNNLYFVMDYYLGGDVLTLLSKFEDRLTEDMVKFYASEMILAIHSIHDLGYVHRDIKPDNVLIGKDGHIRLADFGSCLKMDSNRKVNSTTAVGTPDYISPEILQAMEDGRGVYGPECDWWSLGICIYEMLFGETPFYAESLLQTYSKIMQHKTLFSFPSDEDSIVVSKDAKNLIKNLICDAEERLGQSGIDDFKKHPFFEGIDWDNIRSQTPPYIPEFTSDTDTRNFEPYEPDDPGHDPTPPNLTALTLHLPFVGFTFTSGSALSDRPPLPSLVTREQETGIITQLPSGPSEEEERLRAEVKSLKDELDKSRRGTLSSQKGHDDQASKMKTLERAVRSLKSEKNSLTEQVSDLKESLAAKEKELKEGNKRYRESQDELNRISDKMTDYRSQKRELSRALREKEEEYDEIASKVDSYRKTAKESEREKRSLLNELDDAKAAVSQEKRQKNRLEKLKQELEDEISTLRSKHRRDTSTGQDTQELQKNIEKLQAQLQEKDSDHSEAVKSLEAKHIAEVQKLKELLATSESTNTELHNENNDLQVRLTKVRNRTISELNEGMKEKVDKYEKDKIQLSEEKRELSLQVESLTTKLEESKKIQQQQEEDLKDIKNQKELLSQWEHQIAEIVQLVSDEKNARSYLQTVAKGLVEDVESLRASSSSIGKQKEVWVERRTLRRDKLERVEMQQNFENELRAKQRVEEELTHIRTQLAHTESDVVQLKAQIESLQKENEKLNKENQKYRMGLGSRNDSFTTSIFHHQSGNQLETSTRAAPQKPKVITGTEREGTHELVVRSFDSPTKCDACTSVMFGLVRQGMMCKNCQMSCHVQCKDKVLATCPLPPGQAKMPSGIDIHHGVGTACEGWIQVPKPGGVKKGWTRAYAFVCDFKIFCHEPSNDVHSPANGVFNIFDIRDINFRVSKVTRQDVIHAGEKLIPTIFKISCTHPTCSSVGILSELLIRTDNENERDKWVATLDELQKAARQLATKKNPVISCHGLYSSQQLQLLKSVQSAAIANNDRILLGAEDGLYMFDVADEGLYQCGDKDLKRVIQLAVLQDEELVVILAGRRPTLRLLPTSALDSGEMRNVVIDVTETKGAHLFCTGNLGPTQYICVAIKNKVLIYELSRTKTRYERKKELVISGQVHSMSMVNEKLCIGYLSGFSVFNVYLDQPEIKLVNNDDLSLGFVRINELNAMCAVEINNGQEYLLCFHLVGIYVTNEGRRSRKQELLWHSTPTSIVHRQPYLLVFCESNLEVYNVETSEWTQTISIKKLQSISPGGTIALCNSSDSTCTVYIKSDSDSSSNILHVTSVNRRGTVITKSKKVVKPARPVISGPTEFAYVQHFGPHPQLDVETMQNAGEVARLRGASIPTLSMSQSTQSLSPRKDHHHSQILSSHHYKVSHHCCSILELL
uniref:non-specific serine/threonine protein kinase n=1 Tax=Amphimedon queenslandica TaxID=400682 RepID=A0A1X7VNS0_AMPQE